MYVCLFCLDFFTSRRSQAATAREYEPGRYFLFLFLPHSKWLRDSRKSAEREGWLISTAFKANVLFDSEKKDAEFFFKQTNVNWVLCGILLKWKLCLRLFSLNELFPCFNNLMNFYIEISLLSFLNLIVWDVEILSEVPNDRCEIRILTQTINFFSVSSYCFVEEKSVSQTYSTSIGRHTDFCLQLISFLANVHVRNKNSTILFLTCGEEANKDDGREEKMWFKNQRHWVFFCSGAGCVSQPADVQSESLRGVSFALDSCWEVETSDLLLWDLTRHAGTRHVNHTSLYITNDESQLDVEVWDHTLLLLIYFSASVLFNLKVIWGQCLCFITITVAVR